MSAERHDPEALVEQAKELAAAHQISKAINAYLEAGLAYLFERSDIPRARATFTAAYQLDPQNLEVIYNMGRTDVMDGRVQEGLGKYIDVLRKSNVQHLPALFEAGCVYQSLNQMDQAILAFKRIVDRDPNHVEAMVHMAQLHASRGMQPEAIANYLHAAEIAWDGKQFASARRLANLALSLDPRNQKARYLIADLDEKGAVEEEAPSVEQATVEQARPPHVMVGQLDQGRPLQPPPAQHSELMPSHGELEADIRRLMDERAKLEATLAEERALIETAIRRKSQLHTELAQTQAAIGKAQADVAQAVELRRAQLESDLEDLRARLADARQEAETLETGRAERDEVIAAGDRARVELEAVRRHIEELSAHASALDEANRQAEKGLSMADERARRLRDEIAQLEGHMKYLRGRSGTAREAETTTELASRRTADAG